MSPSQLELTTDQQPDSQRDSAPSAIRLPARFGSQRDSARNAVPQRLGITMPLRRVSKRALLAGAYSCLAVWKNRAPLSFILDIPIGLDAALSFAMALLITFRVNRAYERWWEARTLWGTLVNIRRNLAIKVRTLQRPEKSDCQAVASLIVAFCLGLKDHLRDDAELSRLPGIEDHRDSPKHLPSYIVSRLHELFQCWKSDGIMTDAQIWVIDSEARQRLDVCGGCERIKNALMSISWRSFTLQCILLSLLVLPWGLYDDFGIWTIPITIIAAYIVSAGEIIAQYVEEPFGEHEDHLDLKRICQAIEVSVAKVLLGETDPQQDS